MKVADLLCGKVEKEAQHHKQWTMHHYKSSGGMSHINQSPNVYLDTTPIG